MTDKNIDYIWNENLDRLRGKNGIHILVNDNKDIISQLIKALADVEGLPADLNNPQAIEEVQAIDDYGIRLYELFCEGAEIAETMIVGGAVEKEYNDIQDETGNTRDMNHETGHSEGDF